MYDISNIQDDNLGGLQQICIAPLSAFLSLSPLTFRSGHDWMIINCTSETMPFEERMYNDANGFYYDMALSGSIPQLRPDVEDKFREKCGIPLIVLFQDNNGVKRLAGTTGRVTMLYRSATGTEVNDLNGYQVQITGRQLKSCLFL